MVQTQGEKMDNLIKSIFESSEATQKSTVKLKNLIEPTPPDFLVKSSDQGVSLLDLKNDAFLSYLHSTVLIALAKIEKLKGNDVKFDNAIKNTVVQRVVLERGIKGLEKRINYQLDKSVRGFKRAEEKAKSETENGGNDASKKVSEIDSDAESDGDSDDDLKLRPNTAALAASAKNKATEEKTGKYVPPKISAVAPAKKEKKKKLRSIEEYIEQHGDAPEVGYSIGSEIMNQGRDIKTRRERQKDEEITAYEESNFTRLNVKKGKKRRSEFMGEDWDIFGGGEGDRGKKKGRR